MGVPGHSDYPPLTDDERAMVEANLGLVGFVVARTIGRTSGDLAEELFQDGVVGLMRAAQLFDPARGFRFSTYAMFWIRQGIGRGRERRDGANSRRAARYGDDWHEPLSLDLVYSSEDAEDLTIKGLLADTADPEADALDSVALSELAVGILDECVDGIDRALVLGIADGKSLAEIARAMGVSTTTITNRLRRLRWRLGVDVAA